MSQEREESEAQRITALESAVDGLTDELVDLEDRVQTLEEKLDRTNGTGSETGSETDESKTVEEHFEESERTPEDASNEVIEDDIIIG